MSLCVTILMTTEAHLDAAESGKAEAAKKTAQQARATTRTESLTETCTNKKTPALLGFATTCDFSQNSRVAGAGFEPTTSRL